MIGEWGYHLWAVSIWVVRGQLLVGHDPSPSVALVMVRTNGSGHDIIVSSIVYI